MATTWTLCLTLTTSNSRKIVKVDPNSDTVRDLFRMAGEAFESTVEVLKSGFPPQPLDSDDTTKLSESKNVANQERIQVTLKEKGGKDSKKAKMAKGKNYQKKAFDKQESAISSPNAEKSGTRTSKRAAAKAATESFGEVIKAQDRFMKGEKQPRKKQKTTTTASSPIKSTTKSKKATSKPVPAKSSAFASQPSGRRLADGAVVQAPASARAKAQSTLSPTKRNPKNVTPSSMGPGKQKYEDMSVALMGTLNDSGKMGRILRKGLTNAVQNSYESTKAVTRLAALESRNPTAVQLEKIQNGAKLQVKFDKGAQGRGYFEEVVDWIPVDVLKEVLTAIYNTDQEALRPHNLAFLSPRVLWAMAYDHREGMSASGEQKYLPFSLEDSFKRLLPDLDWSFLRRRKQQLSAKAIENLRQQEEKQSNGQNSAEDHVKSIEAINEVEHAMEHLHRFDKTQRAEQMAKAALARQQQQQQQIRSEDSWTLTTPSETDEDELLECISTTTKSQRDCKLSDLVNGLIELAHIHNWRELANAETNYVYEQLLENKKNCRLTLGQVEGWVDYAQAQSVKEIIVEICDGEPNNVDTLLEKAKSSTPKDLAAWRAMPDVLHEELGSESICISDLTRWCERAHQVLQEYEWLNWYATPIVDE